MRNFDTGATRDSEEGKLDYDGFLSPIVLERYARYMHRHRKQKDGTMRDSDNWQKGFPLEVYRKSAWRHFMDWWSTKRNGSYDEDAACAILFNLMGSLHEHLKRK